MDNKNQLPTGINVPPDQNIAEIASAPGQLKDWLENLPKANLSKSSRLVFSGLLTLRQQFDNSEQRFACLELFHPIVDYLVDSLHQQYLDNSDYSTSTKRAILNLAKALQVEMAQTYMDFVLKSEGFFAEKLHATALYRAVTHLTDILVRCFQLHYQVPENLWRKFYQLYCYAKAQQLEDYPISDGTQTTTIETVFKIPLLLATCNPYQLHPRDIEKVFQILPQWVQQVHLNEIALTTDLYLIFFDRDEAPIYQKLTNLKENKSTYYGLDTNELCDLLRELIVRLERPEEFPATNFSRGFLQHLLRSWGSFPDRAFPRTKQNGDISATVGLAATHNFVDSEQAKTKSCYKTFAWQLVNSSKNGYCLCTTLDYPEGIEVGEIIGLQERDNNNDQYWHIGTIRWMQYSKDNQLHLGVQLLAPNAIAVGLQNTQQQLQENVFLGGLLLPEIAALQQQKTLITPTLPYAVGDLVRMVNLYLDSDAKLTECIGSSLYYKQFAIEIKREFSGTIKFSN